MFPACNRYYSATYSPTGPPLPPKKLHLNILAPNTSDHGVYNVRLEWSPPLDDGGSGEAVTSYQVFVDNILQVTTSSLWAVVDVNSTGEHLVDVRTINCARHSASNITGCTLPY